MKIPSHLKRKILALSGIDAKPSVRGKPTALARPSVSLGVVLPVVTASEINLRDWRGRHRRSQAIKAAWSETVRVAAADLGLTMPCFVHLQRLGGRKLDDDNLRSALKAVRDSVAGWVGVDDGDEGWNWNYSQNPGSMPRGVCVVIGQKSGNL